jgi:hypothetical protein
MRCGASNSTAGCPSAASAASAAARSPAACGRKPSMWKPSPPSPAALIAAVALLAPGTGTTRKPASSTARTTRAPGSDTPGVPASVTSAMRSPAVSLATIFSAAPRSLCSCTAMRGVSMP